MIGDASNIATRLRRLFPQSWFKAPTPNYDALLAGVAANFESIYQANQYARAQMRLQTTTDGFLDLAAWDFFGATFQRRPGETDAQFMPRLVKEITRPRLTRAAIILALYDLTGNIATIIEPFNTGDCGAWDVWGAWAGQTASQGNGGGFDVGGYLGFDTTGNFFIDQSQSGSYSAGAGYWGDTILPMQFFLEIARPAQLGIPNASGFDCAAGGWDSGGLEWVDQSMMTSPVSDQDIYDCINRTKAAGTTCWVRLTGQVTASGTIPDDNGQPGGWDNSFNSSF